MWPQKLASSGESVGWRRASASRLDEEAPELATSGVEGFLLILAVIQKWPAVLDHAEKDLIRMRQTNRMIEEKWIAV